MIEMKSEYVNEIVKSQRIDKLINELYDHTPEIESDRAVLLTQSYKTTESEPIITRRAKAFKTYSIIYP